MIHGHIFCIISTLMEAQKRLCRLSKGKRLFASLVFISTVLLSFTTDPIDTITSALRTGNSQVIAGFFEKSVELTLLDKEGDYSASQAELMLKDFFQKNTPKSFQVIHKGSNKGAGFAIGSMITSAGRKLRVSFHLQQSDGKSTIQEISIQDE